MRNFTKWMAVGMCAVCLSTSLPSPAYADTCRTIHVSDTQQLIVALADVRAGDEIILKSGLYQNDEWNGAWAAFFADADGTPEHPIIIRSEDPSDPAVISGVSQENKVALKIMGSYWQIRDLKVCQAQKGIFLQQSEYSVISGCEVYDIGLEGIHIIDNSCNNLVENCFVHDTGTYKPQYGEGIYIGSAKNTTDYGYECNNNTVRSCRLGPNIAADHVDIKEYTTGNVVENCTFDGSGMKGENGGDSFVEIKGNNCHVRNNVGYRNGCEKVLSAFDLNVQLDGWGQNNKIYGNAVYMDTEACFLVKAWNCNTYVFRNETEPANLGCSGNKIIEVLGFTLNGDTDEDGACTRNDVKTLQEALVCQKTAHFSQANADVNGDGKVNVLDLCLLKQGGEIVTEKAEMSVRFQEEKPGKWRMCNGLGGKTMTYHLEGIPGGTLNLGGGYWNPNAVAEDGSNGVWTQKSFGEVILDENGTCTLNVALPEAVTSVALEVYDYTVNGAAQDKDGVELVKAVAE